MEIKTTVETTHTIDETAIDAMASRIACQIVTALKQAFPTDKPLEPPSVGSILRLSELVPRLGMSRSMIYKKMSEGTFPSSIKLGARAVGWHYADIKEWEDTRV